jgi:hypothetical protein
MKLIITSILVILIIIPLIYATPGRLNAYGCHNSQTEGYHCHRSSASNYSAPSINPTKQNIGEECYANTDCVSGFCVHTICRPQAGYAGDGYCDRLENCLNSPTDCGPCLDNGVCDSIANETCENSKECNCGDNQLCLLTRPNHLPNGCYTISCGDGFIDSGETQENCCIDASCPKIKNLLFDVRCQKIGALHGCKKIVKLWVKITTVILIIFLVALIYNRIKHIKKTHRRV